MYLGKRKAAKRTAEIAHDITPKSVPQDEELKVGTEYYITSRMKSAMPHIVELYIPPYLSRNGYVVPMKHLYPLSRDHLLPLVEYNLYRAISTNLLILGNLNLNNGSPCRFGGSVPIFPNPYQGCIPETLQPTLLQQSSTYPKWIDHFPSPIMRDNAIKTQHLFMASELCADLLGGLMGRENDLDSGLIVWSNPWEPHGWELTEGFVKKWGFLVEGCTDLFQSTNQWREMRGEEPLSLDLN